jgi:hypothetical protein
MPSENTTLLRGFTWVVSRNPDNGLAPSFLEPPGSEPLWAIDGTEDGIRNPVWGDAYLLVTRTSELPRLEHTWTAEPADLEQGFSTQTPGGEVRLARLLSCRRTPWGIVQESEFEVVAPDRVGPKSRSACEIGPTVPEPGLDILAGPLAFLHDHRLGNG